MASILVDNPFMKDRESLINFQSELEYSDRYSQSDQMPRSFRGRDSGIRS